MPVCTSQHQKPSSEPSVKDTLLRVQVLLDHSSTSIFQSLHLSRHQSLAPTPCMKTWYQLRACRRHTPIRQENSHDNQPEETTMFLFYTITIPTPLCLSQSKTVKTNPSPMSGTPVSTASEIMDTLPISPSLTKMLQHTQSGVQEIQCRFTTGSTIHTSP